MLKKEDIISIDVDSNWIQEGIDYALISWTSTFNRMGKPNPYSRIQKIMLGIIAEKAIEKYFLDNEVPFETNGKTKWYEVDRYDIGFNGYAIDVKSNFLDLTSSYIEKKLSNLFIEKLNWFLKCHALVPLDQFNPGNNERRAHKRDKIYIFPFIEGYFNEIAVKKPLVHTFWCYKWLKRAEHKSLPHLGNLNIKYNGKLNASSIRIFGTTDKNKACIEVFSLTEKEKFTKNNFFQVFSIQWEGENPSGILQIESPILKLKEIIKPENSFILEKKEDGYWPLDNNWQSLAFNLGKVHLLGWTFEEDFRINGREFKRFTKTIEQYSEIKVDNWGCLVEDLEAMKNIKNI